MHKLIVVLTILFGTVSVHAAPRSYQYTSGLFEISGWEGVPPVSHMTLNLTADLAPGLAGANYAGIGFYTISDGYSTVDSLDPDHNYVNNLFLVWTDASAILTGFEFSTEWFVDFRSDEYPVPEGTMFYMGMFYRPGIHEFAQSYYCAAGDYVNDEYTGCYEGTRTLALGVSGGLVAVPAPATLALFVSALASLGVSRRKRTVKV